MLRDIGYICIIIVLLIIIGYLFRLDTCATAVSNRQYLSGMWVGDEEFNRSADIQNMFLYIGPQEEGTGYLFMGDKDNIVSNQKIELEFDKESTPKNTNEYTKRLEYNITYDEKDIMPKNMSMEYNIMEGWLKLYSKDILYGYFFKDNSSSVLS